jgi:hypothetical protein
LNKTQHKQKTPFSDSEYLSHFINYRAETDQMLATHLQNSPPNARYLSPTIQIELIDICGRQLQQVIWPLIACATIPYSLNFVIIVVASSSPVVELASANPRNDSIS